MPRAELVASVEEFMNRILADTADWPQTRPPWFRGEPDVGSPNALLPRLYRHPPFPNENALLQNFRTMAPSFASGTMTPSRGDTDKWLCLAQHVRLPTRLLDWTENALLALFFAIAEGNIALKSYMTILHCLANEIYLELLG